MRLIVFGPLRRQVKTLRRQIIESINKLLEDTDFSQPDLVNKEFTPDRPISTQHSNHGSPQGSTRSDDSTSKDGVGSPHSGSPKSEKQPNPRPSEQEFNQDSQATDYEERKSGTDPLEGVMNKFYSVGDFIGFLEDAIQEVMPNDKDWQRLIVDTLISHITRGTKRNE